MEGRPLTDSRSSRIEQQPSRSSRRNPTHEDDGLQNDEPKCERKHVSRKMRTQKRKEEGEISTPTEKRRFGRRNREQISDQKRKEEGEISTPTEKRRAGKKKSGTNRRSIGRVGEEGKRRSSPQPNSR
jgi:hypothetical protein